MKLINFLTIFLVLALVSTAMPISDSTSSEQTFIYQNSNNSAELPTWYEENYWKYDMDFVFTVRKIPSEIRLLKVDAYITDMVATIQETIFLEGEEVYKLDIDGDITGNIEVPVIGDFAQIRGDFGGNAYVSTDSLAMKKFIFNVDGEVYVFGSWHTLLFNMEMTFAPRFDFFNFPIQDDEECWQVDINEATLNADVYIDILGGYSDIYSESTSFIDTMCYKGYEQKNGYDCFLIGGDWGDPSNLWYAPEAGFLAKIQESIFFINEADGYKIQSDFNLNLEETNFDADNLPPEKPAKPVGPEIGVTGEVYSYNTVTSDRENDGIYYMFDWGDGSGKQWIGPYNSGKQISADHAWSKKGLYSVRVRAKDDSSASDWSDALPVLIAGDPHFNCTVTFVKEKDYIDVGSAPEWYYQFILYDSEYNIVDTKGVFNKKTNGDWISSTTWEPSFSHVNNVDNRQINFALKLFDHDSLAELGWEDMADISGSNDPDDQGADNVANNIDDALEYYKRGAVFHGSYDMVNGEMLAYSNNPSDNRDKWTMVDDTTYVTCGDYNPDGSTGDEGAVPDAENDAKLHFKVKDDYEKPVASAAVSTSEENIRPLVNIQFCGSVIEGIPEYSWSWVFDDGGTSNSQNPEHVFAEGGIYNVELTVTDAFEQSSTTELTLDIPYNNIPVLTHPNMEWDKSNDELFFSVHYSDVDGDNPVVKKLVVDNDPYSLKGSGSDNDYYYTLNQNEVGKGTHTYYFHFEDGYGGVAETDPIQFKSGSKSKHFFWLDFFQFLLEKAPFFHFFF